MAALKPHLKLAPSAYLLARRPPHAATLLVYVSTALYPLVREFPIMVMFYFRFGLLQVILFVSIASRRLLAGHGLFAYFLALSAMIFLLRAIHNLQSDCL